MKKLTLVLWALMVCFLLTACDNKKSKDDKGDYVQQIKDIDKDMAKNGDDWDVDEWEKKLREYVDLTDEFIESEPSDEDLEKFNDVRESIKDHFGQRNAQKAIENLMEDRDFVKQTEKSDRKFTKMLQALEDKKHDEGRIRHDEEDEEEGNTPYYEDNEEVPDTAVIYEDYDMPAAEPVSRGTDSKYDVASTRLLSESDLRGMSKYELKVMRNWIFARHGYIFQSDDMKAFFSSQPWYSPRYRDVTPYLSDIEIKNIDFIKRHE